VTCSIVHASGGLSSRQRSRGEPWRKRATTVGKVHACWVSAGRFSTRERPASPYRM
jgi:hypothetical protein